MANILGQETELVITKDGRALTNLTSITDHNLSFKTEIVEEGFIGETTQRYDTVFNGIDGGFNMHFDTSEALEFINSIVDKARRRTPGSVVNIKTTLNFSSGRRARITIPDVAFGPFEMDFGGRTEYGTIALKYSASKAVTIVT